jgi:hypothetical protein
MKLTVHLNVQRTIKMEVSLKKGSVTLLCAVLHRLGLRLDDHWACGLMILTLL